MVNSPYFAPSFSSTNPIRLRIPSRWHEWPDHASGIPPAVELRHHPRWAMGHGITQNLRIWIRTGIEIYRNEMLINCWSSICYILLSWKLAMWEIRGKLTCDSEKWGGVCGSKVNSGYHVGPFKETHVCLAPVPEVKPPHMTKVAGFSNDEPNSIHCSVGPSTCPMFPNLQRLPNLKIFIIVICLRGIQCKCSHIGPWFFLPTCRLF